MNTANLQLEGVLMAMAALCRLMREKGMVDEREIDAALSDAEEMLAQDTLRPEQLSPANVEAMKFPLRFLREANRCMETDSFAYSKIALVVGRTRRVSGVARPQ